MAKRFGGMDPELWDTAPAPLPMLPFLQERHASPQKLRLFAVACVRRVEHLLEDERWAEALDLEEAAAWGAPTPTQEQRLQELRNALAVPTATGGQIRAVRLATSAARAALGPRLADATRDASNYAASALGAERGDACSEECTRQADML